MREVAWSLLALDHGDARHDRASLDREDDAQHDHREGGPLDARARGTVEPWVRMAAHVLRGLLGDDGGGVRELDPHDGRPGRMRAVVIVIVVVMVLLRLGVPVVDVAVRERRRGRGEAGRHGEDAADEARDERSKHELKLPLRRSGGNRSRRRRAGNGPSADGDVHR